MGADIISASYSYKIIYYYFTMPDVPFFCALKTFNLNDKSVMRRLALFYSVQAVHLLYSTKMKTIDKIFKKQYNETNEILGKVCIL